jgi:hypothetical protein
LSTTADPWMEFAALLRTLDTVALLCLKETIEALHRNNCRLCPACAQRVDSRGNQRALSDVQEELKRRFH